MVFEMHGLFLPRLVVAVSSSVFTLFLIVFYGTITDSNTFFEQEKSLLLILLNYIGKELSFSISSDLLNLEI